MTASALKVDAESVDAAIEFIQEITPADAFGNVCAIPVEGGCTGFGFRGDDLGGVRRFIEQHRHENLYWSVNSLGAAIHKKPVKADIVGMRYAHVDVDDPSPEALERLKAASLPATLIIFSGGGWQAFWRLAEPVHVNGNLAELEAVNQHLIDLFGGDRAAWNLDRIMRLPWTVNWLNKTKIARGREPAETDVRVHDRGRIYTLDALRSMTCSKAPPKAQPKGKAAKQPKESGTVDRSRDLMAKVRLAVNAGRAADEIVAEYITHPHAAEQSDPERAVRRCIEKVRASAADFMRNDTGNAQRLVALHGEDFRYCVETGQFHLYDGVRWAPDPQALQMLALLKETNRQIWDAARTVVDGEKAKALGKWAVQSQNTAKLKAAIESAKSEPGISVHFGAFDADPMLLGVRNGVIDLRTGEFRASRREDYISKSTSCEYIKDAKCPRFERLLASMFEPAVVAYVKRVLGYILTGRTDEQCLFFLLGVAAAGKSVLIEAVKELLGDYAANMRTDSLAAQARSGKGGPSEDEVRLAGRRFVSVNETEDGMRLNASFIKDITGDDTITARHMYAASIEFRPQFKLMIRGNHKPHFDGSDSGMARRVKLLWCSRAVAPGKRDPQLKAKLLREMPGILNYAIAGCLEWQRDGLREPESVSAATRGYLDELDTLGLFIDDNCLTDDKSVRIGSRALYSNYALWAKERGLHPWSETRFSRKLQERGISKEHTRAGNYFVGIKLRLTPVLKAGAPTRNGDGLEADLERMAEQEQARSRH